MTTWAWQSQFGSAIQAGARQVECTMHIGERVLCGVGRNCLGVMCAATATA